MDNMAIDLGVATFNVNGLKESKKRAKIFKWLQEKRETIIFLQETHSTPEAERKWEQEWGGKIFFSHGRSNSTGVAILVKNSEGDAEIINVERDQVGRRIIVELKIRGTLIRFVNFYGPNKDDTLFLEEMFKVAYSNNSTSNIIIAGDFNAVMDNKLDLSKNAKGEYRVHTNKKAQLLLNAVVNDCNLIDIFRLKNPDKLIFSHVNKKYLTQSRLDFFLIDKSLESLSNCRYDHGLNSDHSYVTLNIKGEQIERGRGYWKFNNSFLEDAEFVADIRTIITETCNSSYDSYGGLWDVIKMKIKDHSSRIGAKKKREKNREKKRLEGEIGTIRENLNGDNNTIKTEELYTELFEAENLLNELLNKEMEGIIVRAKLQWVEDGEKSTRYFMGLEKSKQGKKSLLNLVNEEGQILNTQAGIENHTVKFYRKLFSSCNPEKSEIDQYLEGTSMKKIPEELSERIDREISKEELDAVVKSFKNNKSPGSDGLTAEFYKHFWGELREILYKVYKEGLERGCLTPSQRMGVITLLPKGEKDHTDLKNWRPITLLNIDYKIYVHVIKNRLRLTLPGIISCHQTGFQRGKSTTDNLILMYLVLEYYERNPEEEGYLVQIDFEKAFDSVEHDYLFSVLKKIGIGNQLIHMIKVAFSGCSSMILVNGHLSEPVYLCRGLHQGSPLSPILFILTGQSLTDRCLHNEKLKGITVDNVEVLMSLFADDTDTFVREISSIAELLKELDRFGRVSGCVCNRDKTKCVPLGAAKEKSRASIVDLLGQGNVVDSFAALGIHFENKNLKNIVTRNYEEKIAKANEWAVRWSRRYLTLFGKITIIKTLLLSQFVYLIVPLLSPPATTINRIQTDMYKFVWGGKPDKIKRAVTNNTKPEGGIEMIEFTDFFTSLKLKLVGILISENNNPLWKRIVQSQLDHENIEIAIENNKVKKGCLFTQDLLAHYEVFLQKVELAKNRIRNRCIWFNKQITDMGRPLVNQSLVDYGIMYITDFLGTDVNGEYYLMNYTEFKTNKMGGMNIITVTQYLKIKMGIRRAFSDTKLKSIDQELKVSLLTNSNGKVKGSGGLRRNHIYKGIDFKDITPCKKWEDYFETESEIPWKNAFETLYLSTRINKLREFQYKLIHRVATCRYMRKKMKIESTDMCHMCGISSETLEHQQFNCPGTKKLRDKLEGKLRAKLPDAVGPQKNLDFLTCISSVKVISFVRMVANYYINKKFHKKKLLWWEEYSAWVKREIKTESRFSQEEKHLVMEILDQ